MRETGNGVPGTLMISPTTRTHPCRQTSRVALGHQFGFLGEKGDAMMKPVVLVLFLLLLSACGFPAWRDQVMQNVVEGRWQAIPDQVPPGSAGPPQTVEFYDAGGRHVGYGVIGSGSAEFYNVDGSRAGLGRIGR